MNAKAETQRRPKSDAPPVASRGSYSTLLVALLGAVLMWAALPPLGIGVLGWIAPVPWLWLARRRELLGRRPYWAIWLGALAFWLGALHWLRLPHWATSFGWVALSIYLACYTPLIVALARFASRRIGISIVVSAPILWTACDQIRAYFLSGFSMASLSHSQYRWTPIIQSADAWGEFGVTFLMVLAAAAIARALPIRDEAEHATWSPGWFGLAGVVVAAMFGYGSWRLGEIEVRTTPGPKIALIQGSIDTEMKYDPKAPKQIYDHYLSLSRRAVQADPSVQVVVWPETMFPAPTWSWSDDAAPGPTDEWTMELVKERGTQFQEQIELTAHTLGKPLLIGIDATRFVKGAMLRWNSALYTDAQGKHLGRYAKQHAVPFGEYTPFAKDFPFLYALTPLTGGIEEGERAEAFDLKGVKLVPSICYESVLARVIRRQMVELRERGIEPDVLVNVTNDGWFWGSSELDLHLICGVFRAVECRKPLVIAANTGFSAHIDSAGRVIQQGPRREADFINAAVMLDPSRSLYSTWGDWLANGCTIATFGLLLVAITTRRKKQPSAATS
jgi:apolipoprotein N-acyltransferase